MASTVDYKDAQREADKALQYRYPEFSGDIFKEAFITYTDGSKYQITPSGLRKINERDAKE